MDIGSNRGSGDRGSRVAVQKIEASRWTRNGTGVRTNNITFFQMKLGPRNNTV